MRQTYRFLAFAIAALVILQAGTIAWAFFGLSDWVKNDNGVVNKQFIECRDCEEFTAQLGFAFHMFFVGLVLIPLLSLILLIVSFFAKVPRGVALAATLFGLIVLQVILLPMASREIDPAFGALHGINALVLLWVSYLAGKRAEAPAAADSPAPAVT